MESGSSSISPADDAGSPQGTTVTGAGIVPDHLSAALARIASAAPGTLERRDFVTAVGEAAVAVLPFDSIAVLLYDAPPSLRLYSVAGTLPAGSGEVRVSL